MSTNPLEIALARHGKSEFSVGRWISGSSLRDLVRRYDEAGINRATGPPPALVALAARSQCVVASDLKRAVESAQVLAAGREVVVDPGLREACLPDSLGLSVSLPSDRHGQRLAHSQQGRWGLRSALMVARSAALAGRPCDRLLPSEYNPAGCSPDRKPSSWSAKR